MRISRLGAALLLIPTIFPAAYFFTFLLSFGTEGSATEIPIFGSHDVMMRLHIAAMIVGLGIIIFYVVHAFKNPDFSSDRRLLWVVLVLLGGFFAAPVYWYLFLWRTPEGAAAEGPVEA